MDGARTVHGSSAGLECLQFLREERVVCFPVLCRDKERTKQPVSSGFSDHYGLVPIPGELTSNTCNHDRVKNPCDHGTVRGILSIEPRRRKPSVLAALFQTNELRIVLLYEGFAISWNRPVMCVSGRALFRTSDSIAHSRARSRAMSYLSRLIVAMIALPSSSFAALSGKCVSSWFTEYTLSMTLVRITGHRLTTVSYL
jgi:hypothetical protein